MTPLQFARAECANYDNDGSCKGIDIKDDGSMVSFGRKDSCVLGTRGVRCVYFEQCVMPIAGRAEPASKNQDYVDAAREYRLRANVPSEVSRPCPVCGRALEPRRRLCYVCAESKRKATLREANRKRSLGYNS